MHQKIHILVAIVRSHYQRIAIIHRPLRFAPYAQSPVFTKRFRIAILLRQRFVFITFEPFYIPCSILIQICIGQAAGECDIGKLIAVTQVHFFLMYAFICPVTTVPGNTGINTYTTCAKILTMTQLIAAVPIRAVVHTQQAGITGSVRCDDIYDTVNSIRAIQRRAGPLEYLNSLRHFCVRLKQLIDIAKTSGA